MTAQTRTRPGSKPRRKPNKVRNHVHDTSINEAALLAAIAWTICAVVAIISGPVV